MTIFRTGHSARVVIVALSVLVLLGFATLRAQERNPLDAISAKLDVVTATLDGLVNPRRDTTVVLSTPLAVAFGSQIATCSVLNVGSTPIDVAGKLRHRDGSVISESEHILSAKTGGLFGGYQSETGDNLWCQVIFKGDRNDIRAALIVAGNPNFDPEQVVLAVPAQ